MTEPEPTQPEPDQDPGHILTVEQWDRVTTDRQQIEDAVAASEADPTPIDQIPDQGTDLPAPALPDIWEAPDAD